MKYVLITGGTGFIGAHVVDYLLQHTNWFIYIIDRLDSTSTLNRIKHLDQSRIKFIYHNLRSPFNNYIFSQLNDTGVNYVLHLAASTHVDRSISRPEEFIYDNVFGTHNLLWACQELLHLEKILYFSTDEVFGSAKAGENFKEWDRYYSKNPYAATKAGAEELCLAYHNTYGLPILISHTMNVFGEMQHSEKFIPKSIKNILEGTENIVHADKTCTHPGSRYYIHAKDVAKAVLFLILNGDIGDKYNIVGEQEINNLDLLLSVGKVLGKQPLYKLVDFHSSRPGHDLRYALDGSKLKDMGFKHSYTFMEALTKTVNWYVLNQKEWLT